MMQSLSPYKLRKARSLYNLFNVFNAVSWNFLAGNIITLFALRLGASSTYIGIINAVLYIAFFFLPFGRLLTNRFSIVKIFSVAWACRAIGMIPLLFAPFVFISGNRDLALILLLLGVTVFHVIRGVGMIANSPVLSFLSAGPDRGSYMTQVQIVYNAVAMLAGFVTAMLLDRDPPLFIYTIIFAVGIVSGILSGFTMRKCPGPEHKADTKKTSVREVLKEAMAEPPIRLFITIVLLVVFVSAVSRIFLVVYCREIFGQNDGMILLFSVFGGLGTLIVMLFIKFIVDQIGAKPIFIVCVIIGLLSMIPILFFPASLGDNFTTVTLYLSFLFFMLNFGWLGADGIMQTYFLGLVPSEKVMDIGILFFFCYAIGGAGGSFLSGLFLDAVTAISGSPIISFRAFYGLLIGVTAITLFLMRKLTPLGALPFKDALEVMFSYKDLKAISLLEKLNKTNNSGDEEALLGALYNVPSNLATKGLLSWAKSPRFSVRMESIRAIDALPSLNEEAERVLMDDIVNNPYTTAYRSARTLGNHGIFPSVPLLRELAVSSDYMLAGEAIIALAKLRDDAFKPEIERIVIETNNPRLKIAGVEAMGIYGHPESLPLLLDILRVDNPPPYLRDEVAITISSLLDIQNKFYPLLVRFLNDESMASTLAFDETESAFEYYTSAHGRKRLKKNLEYEKLEKQANSFNPAVSDYIQNSSGSKLCRWILELPDHLVHAAVQTILSEVVLDDDFIKHRRLHLLIVHWCAHELRLWTNNLEKQ